MRISDWSSDVCSSDLRLASRQGCANGNVRGEYGMAERPILLVTRKLPSAVEERAARDYRARLNPEDAQFEAAVLIAGSAGADAILTCSTEKFPADLIAALPDSVRAIATFSVGYDHIDVAAARKRGLVVTNTPDVLTDATADVTMLLLLGAARRAHEEIGRAHV